MDYPHIANWPYDEISTFSNKTSIVLFRFNTVKLELTIKSDASCFKSLGYENGWDVKKCG